MRAIDADHLKRWILSRVFKTQLSVADVVDQIDREDTIEPERKTGRWIKAIDELGEAWSCSECTTEFTVDEMSEFPKWAKYCPECGSYNGGEQE